MSIVAKEGDRTADEYEVKTAKFYDIIEEGTLPALASQMDANQQNNVPSTVSIADLLEGVKGRDGKFLVNKNGGLNYNSEIFKGIKEPSQYSVERSSTESINPNEEYVQGLNDTDADKVNTLAKSFEDKGYVGRPIVVIDNANEGYIALTGSHRIKAAKQADIELKAIVLENNEDTVQLIDVRDDDERANIAK